MAKAQGLVTSELEKFQVRGERSLAISLSQVTCEQVILSMTVL